MKVASTIGFLAGMFGRGPGFMWTGYKIISGWYAEGSTGFVIGGSFAFVMMLIFNLLILKDAVGEFIKFLPMKFEEHDHDTLKRTVSRMGSSLSVHGGITRSDSK